MLRHTRFGHKFAPLALVILVVVGLAHLTAQGAQANIRLGGGGEVPFYARLEAAEVFHTDDWAVIVFYRPPECVPDDFNLLDFFHFPGPDGPGAFGCNPATTDGFSIWENGPEVDLAPIQSVLHGLGAVPVWFVDWPALQDAMQDGRVTIVELWLLEPLTGSASLFHEVLQPSESATSPMINFTASGSLDGGGSFWVHAMGVSASGHLSTQIDIEP